MKNGFNILSVLILGGIISVISLNYALNWQIRFNELDRQLTTTSDEIRLSQGDKSAASTAEKHLLVSQIARSIEGRDDDVLSRVTDLALNQVTEYDDTFMVLPDNFAQDYGMLLSLLNDDRAHRLLFYYNNEQFTIEVDYD